MKKQVDIITKGGNYLLNIGHGPGGEFGPGAYDRLEKMGRWMKINGEAICGTRMFTAYSEGEKIRFTRNKSGTIRYIFLFEFPCSHRSC